MALLSGASRHQWGALAAAILALGMMTIDVSIVRVALPTIQNELNLSDAAQQWVVNAYLLTMGTFAIAGGRAGDRLGRRKIFMIGVIVFIVCSVAAGLADSGGMLIAARAGQGIGAAIMTPGNTAIVTDAFTGPTLAKAMGLLVGVGTIGVSIGPLLGGILIEEASWRWVFLINVPVSLVLIWLVYKFVPERIGEKQVGLDPAGLLTLLIGMTALTLGLVQAPAWGFGATKTVALLVGSVVVLAAWLRIERRVRDPLVDPKVIRGPMLGGHFVAFCVPFVYSGLSVLFAIYLQNVLQYPPLKTGFLMLPLAIPTFVGSLCSGWLASRLGPRTVVTAGMALAAIGVFAIGLGTQDATYGRLLPGLVVFAFGGGVALPPMTSTIMASATVEERGEVSGVYNTARLLGASIGLAVMGSLLGTLEASRIDEAQAKGQLTAAQAGHVRDLLSGGESLKQFKALGEKDEQKTEDRMRKVFDTSFGETLMLSSIVAAIGALVAFLVIPRLRAPPAAKGGQGTHPAIAEAA